jgi:hypothetical protein
MQDQFIYTMDDVLRLLDALLADRGGAWWNEFFSVGCGSAGVTRVWV